MDNTTLHAQLVRFDAESKATGEPLLCVINFTASSEHKARILLEQPPAHQRNLSKIHAWERSEVYVIPVWC